jgi:hypothetical protein
MRSKRVAGERLRVVEEVAREKKMRNEVAGGGKKKAEIDERNKSDGVGS